MYEVLRTIVFPAISLGRVESASVAFIAAVVLAGTWSGVALRRPAGASRPPLSALELLLAAQFKLTECAVLLTPAPLTAIALGVLLALLTILTVPLTLPVALGANTTFNSAVCPAAIVAPAKPPLAL